MYLYMYIYTCVCVCKYMYICIYACTLSHFSSIWLSVTPWTVACQVPLSMRFSRQEYWSELPCPPPGDIPSPGIKPVSPGSPALQADSSPAEQPGKPPGASVPGQPTCNGPNVCAPFRSPWRGVFKEVIKVKWGHKGGFSSSRIGDLVRRRIRELPHSLLKEDIARCGQASASWEENLTRNWKGWHLELGPPASRTVRNNFLLLKLQVAQVSCYGNTSRPRRMVYIEFCLHVQNECIMHISLAHRFPWFRERS